MKLPRILQYGIATGLMAALILPSKLVTAMDFWEAGPSDPNHAADTDEDLPRARMNLAPRNPPAGLTPGKFPAQLDPQELSTFSKIRLYPDHLPNPYNDLLYWNHVPLFDLSTPPAKVGQALVDELHVGIVDPATHKAEEIWWTNGQLEHMSFPNQDQVTHYFRTFADDKPIRDFARLEEGELHPQARSTSTALFPHYEGYPIFTHDPMTQGRIDASHLSHAYQTRRTFWYQSKQGDFYQFSRENPVFYRPVARYERAGINAKLYVAGDDQSKYGRMLTSLLHGEPIYVVGGHDYTPTDHMPTLSSHIPWRRNDLTDAIDRHGGFVWRHPPYQADAKEWRVTVKQPAGPYSTMRFNVEEIQRELPAALEGVAGQAGHVHV